MNAQKCLVAGLLFLGLAAGPAIADDPPRLVGTWTWKWKDAQGEEHRHVLEVEGTGDKLAARERFDDEAAVKVDDFKVTGKDVKFSVLRKKRRSEYRGTLDSADTIKGEVTVAIDGQESEFAWTAKREASGK